jgi:hypothetical protein
MRKAHLIICAFLAIAALRSVRADSPSSKPIASLKSANLSGTWSGKAEGVEAKIEFHDTDACGDNVTWHLRNNKGLISADMKLIDESKDGTVALRADFKKQTGEKGSEIIGRLERGPDGIIFMTVLPVAERIDGDYVAARHIELRQVSAP